MTCASPCLASAVTLSSAAAQPRARFCYYDVGGILHADSNLALKSEDSTAAGSKVLLTNPAFGGTHQSWSMEKGGTIVLKATPSLALSASSPDGEGDRAVIIDKADSTDLKQKWLNLENSQNVYNGVASNAVLTDLNSGSVGVRAKAEVHHPNCGGIGTTLQLKSWSPGDPGQGFTYFNRDIIHTATGLILAAQVDLTTGTVALADPSTNGLSSQWSMLAGDSDGGADHSTASSSAKKSYRKRLRRQSPGRFRLRAYDCWHNYLYRQDDIVKISLENKSIGRCLEPFELKNSITHPDNPFERGTKDVFALPGLEDIGQVTHVTFNISKPHWYAMEDGWLVTGVSVSNSKWHTNSMWMVQQMPGLAALDMRDKQTLPMLLAPSARYNCTMRLGMAPAQHDKGKLRGWDHTWIEVINKTEDSEPTYFDCVGGHRGSQWKTEDMGICDRNAVVRMSTGHDIDAAKPLKKEYGANRTHGFENANLRCDGKLKWDGQCHQIANRYLWTCVPFTSIDDLPYEKQPHGYFLSVLIFGKYGVGFAQWCLDNGFGYIDVDEDLQFANWYQTLGLGARDGWRYVYTRTLQLRHDLSKSADPRPDGQEVKDVLQDFKSKDRKSVRDLAEMTHLTEREVQELMGDTGGWWG